MIDPNDRAEAEMPSGTALRYRLRFPDDTRIGPFPAQPLIDLYMGGGVPEAAFVRREPDGAWLPFHTVFRNLRPRKVVREEETVRDRRRSREFTIIDRRKGTGWVLSQMGLFASLLIALLLVLR